MLLILVIGQLVNTACGANALLLAMAGRECDLLAIRAVWAASLILIPFGAVWFGMIGAAIASVIVMAGWNLSAVAACRIRLGIWPVFLFRWRNLMLRAGMTTCEGRNIAR